MESASGVDAQLSSAFSLHKRRPSSPTSTTTLNHSHISEALLKSEDNGATLDFSHRGLTDIDEGGATQLAAIGREDPMEDEGSVLRVTLASNRLATLPVTFALLSRLRYLNLKNNCLTVFPDVLTAMSSLEILDIGRNKLNQAALPTRVFSFYKNKITRLPPYIAKFTRLSILRAEQNPWEWPPKSIMEVQPTTKDFIKTVQQWIEANASSEYREEPERESQRSNLESEENAFLDDSTPHAHSFSLSSTPPTPLENSASRPSPLRSGRPSPLPLEPVSFSGRTSSPPRSPDAYLPTHEDFLDLSTDDDMSRPPSDTLAHVRNASYAGSSRVSGRANLFSKKSLPDLRHTKLPLAEERPIRSPSAPLWNGPTSSQSVDQPPSSRQDSSNSSDSGPINSRPGQAFFHGEIASSPVTRNRPAPTIDGERHSYFRRFSVLQSSTISKTIPDSLLRLVDAARGILFAVSQIYQALRHYTVDAIDERLASVLLKVLDPASSYITQLINALDRFDSMSRRTLPTPLVCRGVFESCKDNVAIFGKAVGVLALQLKVLATQDDVRYTRQMLLVLYGAAAEISNAWRSMVPHLESVEPLLRDHRPPPATKTRPGGQGLGHPVSPNTIASPAHPLAPFPARSTFVPSDSTPAERTHIARRHAGSFSSRDVETGRIMASSDEPTIFQKGVAVGTAAETPTPRAARRQPGLLPLYSASLATSVRKGSQSRDAHSRQGSLSSLVESSSSSSPSIAGRLAVDIPTTLDSLVDKEAIDAMGKAVEAAPPVWMMMDSIIADVSEKREDIKEMLVRAQRVTQQLKSDISLLRDGTYVDRKSLRNDAHLFVKLVVHLSTDVKIYVDSHPLSTTLRANMVKLTNATEEFVILLHVSSFSNTSTPRPYTPLVNGLSSNSAILGVTSEDSHLGASLTRSRSALATTSRIVTAPSKDMPLSALPQQAFRIPPIPHRPRRTPVEDGLDVM
ncbi:RAM signaling pathway protein-domain-containing protein [Lactarius indigo]|nr:RAM signaling pathway protein-domain-containing protein [Lactarius indigo]